FFHFYLYYFVVFFFQAEDGIRDRNVTGVQTCALPISYSSKVSRVVPGTSVTIALLSWIRLFSMDDLPTLGLPTMTVAKPSLIIFPCVPVSNNLLISDLI